jgi:hypothetical protein
MLENLKRGDYLVEFYVYGSIILKKILERYSVRFTVGLNGLREMFQCHALVNKVMNL